MMLSRIFLNESRENGGAGAAGRGLFPFFLQFPHGETDFVPAHTKNFGQAELIYDVLMLLLHMDVLKQ